MLATDSLSSPPLDAIFRPWQAEWRRARYVPTGASRYVCGLTCGHARRDGGGGVPGWDIPPRRRAGPLSAPQQAATSVGPLSAPASAKASRAHVGAAVLRHGAADACRRHGVRRGGAVCRRCATISSSLQGRATRREVGPPAVTGKGVS